MRGHYKRGIFLLRRPGKADPGGRQEGDCFPLAGKMNMGRIGLAPRERYRKFHLTHVKRPPSDQGLDPPIRPRHYCMARHFPIVAE